MRAVTPEESSMPVDPADPREALERSSFAQYVTAASVIFGITLTAFVLRPLVGYRAIALIYLLAVVVMALFVRRGPTLLAATMSALLWDYCFIAPVANLRISDAEDLILFGMYFVVALALGQLTARIRAQEKARRQGEERATALYLLVRELVEATTLDQVVQGIVKLMGRTFASRIAVLLPQPGGGLGLHAHAASTYDITGPEQPAVLWAFEQRQAAGKFTSNLPHADSWFAPMVVGGRVLGVIGLNFLESAPLTEAQRSLLDACVQQIALALERDRLRLESEKANLLVESERLSKNLLNSISHEIRTPLAAIKGATSNLFEFTEPAMSDSQKVMVGEIQEAGERLDRLVGKVLDITRLESGHVKPRLVPCDVTDLVHMALKETRKELAHHPVTVNIAAGLPIVPLDFVLTQQALTNLLSNAAYHTPAGTAMQVSARVRKGDLVLAVADRGPGIPVDSLPRIFDKFFRGPAAPTGGTGLGLSLVKGFVEAQGGEVKAENRPDGGAIFTITLPVAQTSLPQERTDL